MTGTTGAVRAAKAFATTSTRYRADLLRRELDELYPPRGVPQLRVVYIAHPVSGNVKANLASAAEWVRAGRLW